MGPTDDQLDKLQAAIDAAEIAIAKLPAPQPRLIPLAVTIELRNAFQVFSIPFDRTKRSPAAETLFVILNFLGPTGTDAVDHCIRKAIGE